jgi:hypothetical protein
MLAVIVVVPTLRAVASPEDALMVATLVELEAQVTCVVTFWLERCDALPKVPVAVNCTV